jgi:hypothetical protein
MRADEERERTSRSSREHHGEDASSLDTSVTDSAGVHWCSTCGRALTSPREHCLRCVGNVRILRNASCPEESDRWPTEEER